MAGHRLPEIFPLRIEFFGKLGCDYHVLLGMNHMWGGFKEEIHAVRRICFEDRNKSYASAGVSQILNTIFTLIPQDAYAKNRKRTGYGSLISWENVFPRCVYTNKAALGVGLALQS